MNLCPFCDFDRTRIFAETEVGVALWDGYPVVEGHTLVVPRCHVASIYQLGAPDQLRCGLGRASTRDASAEFAADGINIGVNDGWAAGQTVEHAYSCHTAT